LPNPVLAVRSRIEDSKVELAGEFRLERVIRLCKAGDVKPGDVRQIEVSGREDPLALYNLDGKYYLTEDTCTHGFASLSQGSVEGDLIFCPLHGGAFRIATGEAVELPCTVALRTFRVWIENDEIVTSSDEVMATA
jgi:nitrite reductase/ring-hydroxylating ferredoxin subunit